MNMTLKRVCIALIWLYSITVGMWWGLHNWLGDSVWWLALINIFAPYLFLPIVLLLPACLFCRSRLCWVAVLPGLIFAGLYGHLFLPNQSIPIIAVTGTTTADPSLTIMTFNIWGHSRSHETARVILDNDSPDIVAIQELTPQMAKILEEEVTEKYPYQILDTQTLYGGMGVLSRYPLTKVASSNLAHPDWRIQTVEVETEYGNFILYNVHFNSTEVLAYLENGLPVGDNVQASFQLRKQLVKALVNDISQRHMPVILAGDLNSTDQSETYQLLDSVMTDAHYAAGRGFGHTFPAYGGSIRGVPFWAREIRIDMIFYSDEFVALSSQVGTTYGESDHLPVLAQLVWQK
jgi:vancomycin resistance protein VanJ